MRRQIKDILHFRGDLSPFLVHLTKRTDDKSAREVLHDILSASMLIAGANEISIAKYGGNTTAMSQQNRQDYFGAICFTETPLSEIHTMLDISSRQIQLSEYGLVFIKDKIIEKEVSPVIYLNNIKGNQQDVVQELFKMINTSPNIAKKILPLVSAFGKYITPPGSTSSNATIDFTWEREWRLPAARGDLTFDIEQDVFIGLCAHDDIDEFERRYPPLKFIDPTRNIKWYATKLIDARQRHDMKYAVV